MPRKSVLQKLVGQIPADGFSELWNFQSPINSLASFAPFIGRLVRGHCSVQKPYLVFETGNRNGRCVRTRYMIWNILVRCIFQLETLRLSVHLNARLLKSLNFSTSICETNIRK